MNKRVTLHSKFTFKKFIEDYQKVPVREYPNRVLQVNPKPRFTIRVITYQHEPFIRKCLDGILMQEIEHPYEIVIGEDQSTDGTREICIEYADKYPEKIRLFLNDRQNNIEVSGKPSSLFNICYVNFKCRGEYTLTCEGDDYWTDPFKIVKQYDLMQQYPECHISFHPTLIKNRDEDQGWIYKKHKDHNHVFSVEELILGGGEFCPTNSVMTKGKPEVYSWRVKVPVGDYYLQIMHSLNGGALYINKVMSVYIKDVPGSWSDRHSTFFDQCKHAILMCKSNRMFDKISDFRFHNYFVKRENYLLKKHSVFKAWSYDAQTVEKVKSLINNQTEGVLKMKCYMYLIFSFLYYRLNFKKLFHIKHQILGKS